MEKRLNKKIETYVAAFKEDIIAHAEKLNLSNDERGAKLLEYICDYNRLVLVQDDFIKRKRVKNVVPFLDRCCAKRATDEQCTRRKKPGCEYCGTHAKGVPNGIITDNGGKPTGLETKTIEVWAQDIKGIIYYIDKCGNVYKAEDVVSNKMNPQVIAHYELDNGVYSIPSFKI